MEDRDTEYDPMGPGLTGTREDVALVSHRDEDGKVRTAILPRSMTKLTGDALEAVSDLQRAALAVRKAQEQVAELVAVAREMGVSWDAIGWSVGTTGRAASMRWSDRAPDD